MKSFLIGLISLMVIIFGVLFAAANTTTVHYSTTGIMQPDGTIEWSETIVEVE